LLDALNDEIVRGRHLEPDVYLPAQADRQMVVWRRCRPIPHRADL